MPNENPMLRVQDVKFRYDPEQPRYAVDGVSMEIRRGEFVAVLGANGCGKSTLAKHFNAILLPETGTVLVEDMDTRSEEHLYDVRQKVGMVFQNPDNQIVATIVEEDVAFAPENLGVPPAEIRTRIDEAMKLAGIYEKREAAPYKLSGGQKQRVAIAGVIAMRPDCLVLDEATAMLDPHGRAQVMRTIRQLREAGITPDPANLINTLHPFSADSAIAMGRQLARRGGFTAICVSGDQYAVAIMAGLRERGVRVPEDISIVGFDDVDIARMCTPTLTTIRQDGIGKGERAA